MTFHTETKNQKRFILDDLPREILIRMFQENSVCESTIRGTGAEYKLMESLRLIPEVRSVSKIPDANNMLADLLLDYKGSQITIEVKTISSTNARLRENGIWSGKVEFAPHHAKKIEFPDGTQSKLRYKTRTDFDIFAVCGYTATGTWDFLFAEVEELPHANCKVLTPSQNKFLLPSTWTVHSNFAFLTTDISDLLENVYVRKTQI